MLFRSSVRLTVFHTCDSGTESWYNVISVGEERGRGPEFLIPQTPEKMKEMFQVVFYKPVTRMPTCIMQDFIDVS